MVYAFALVAAVIVALGEVIQQRMAAQAPPQDNLSPKLLLWLVQQPRWLAGVLCSFAGDAAFAAGVGRGSVVVVEAVFTIRLLFGLVIASLWGWHRIPGRNIAGGLIIIAGLVAFLLAAQPRGSGHAVADIRWSYGAGAPVAVAVALALVARRHTGTSRALPLGVGAGVLFGLQAALIQSAVHVMTDRGVVALLLGWHGYAVVVVALLGMLLVQSAFESAPLSSSYPGVVTAQLLCAICIGVFVLHGQLRLGALSLAVILLALLAMIAGIVIITRSSHIDPNAEHPGLPVPEQQTE